ncbi:MAG: hypothetical protein QXJ97_05975 [Desulfurococcaceae archaeon]
MSLLSSFDNSLYKVRSDKLLESVLRVLSGRKTSSIDEAVSLFEKELALIGNALKLRSRVLELLVKLEHYSKFKQEVLRTYVKKLGISMSEKPRLRICRNYGKESVCIATEKTTRWIGDETVYTEFKRYLQIKEMLIETLNKYKKTLNTLLESDYMWVRKLARSLLRELRSLSRAKPVS